MGKFAVGDKVVVTKVECPSDNRNFAVGHVGVYQGNSLVDFKDQDNSFVADDGRWYVAESCLKLWNPLLCAENIAPKLWNAYKDALPQEDLDTLGQVIEDVDNHEKIQFRDTEYLDSAFYWDETPQGQEYWCDLAGTYSPSIDDEEHDITDYSLTLVEERVVPVKQEQTSEYFLQKAIDLQRERGKEYDAGKERSMGKNVAVFNIITGHALTESDGWLFMQLLKDVRQWTKPDYHADSAEDCVSYASLKAEALANGR